MALGNALALSVATPDIRTMENFQNSQANAQNMRAAKQQQEAAAFEQLAQIGFGVMDGNLDGPIDPAKLEQAASMLGDSPLAAKIKEDPEFLRTVTKGSLKVLMAAQDSEKFELAKKQLEADLAAAQQNQSLKTREMDLTERAQDFKESQPLSVSSGETLLDPKTHQPIYTGPFKPGADGAGGETFAMQPTYYKVTDPATGKATVRFGQMGSKGTFKPTELPEGAEPAIPVQQLNTGTEFVPATKFGDRPADAPVTSINNEQAAYDTATGKGQAELDVAKPEKMRKVQGALSALERQQGIVGQDIDKAINAADTNGLFTTGLLGDLTKAVPGTPAYDLAQTLLTIQANIGFDRLQEMRNNSPTGGALGAISDKETALLQAVNGALAQGQSKDQFKANLQRIKDLQAEVLAERKAAFEADFGGGAATSPAAAGATGGGAAGAVTDWTDYFD